MTVINLLLYLIKLKIVFLENSVVTDGIMILYASNQVLCNRPVRRLLKGGGGANLRVFTKGVRILRKF